MNNFDYSNDILASVKLLVNHKNENDKNLKKKRKKKYNQKQLCMTAGEWSIFALMDKARA